MAESDPFLDEAVRRGLLSSSQAADLTRLDVALREVQVELPLEEIAARKGFLTPEQSAEIRRALARLRVGRYEVIERLGEGAAGIVWKARDTKLDRIVALKLLSQKAQVSPSFRERFLREARIAVTLNHVNIVRGLDYGEADGYQFFAMEFVDGENAEARLLRIGRFPEKEAVAMALDVVRALEYVQKFQVVHRDIKPGNLLLTPSGHVKLCDLGLAKPILAEKELLESDGMTAGTPYYMSPEQIREPEKIDWRSDVYSLGATLYHLLTGVPVFRPDGQASVIQRHLRERPRNPREHVLELSDGAASVVMRMLQKAPEDRYASFAELTGDLEAVLDGRPPLHTAPPVPPELATAERHARHAVARRITERTNPREAFPWTTAAVLGLFVVAIAAVAIRSAATSPTPPADTPAAPAPPPADREGPVSPRTPPAPGPTPAPTPPVIEPDPLAEREAKEALRELVEDLVPRQVADGRFRVALQMLDDFAAKHAGTAAAARVPEAKARVEATASGRFEEIASRASDLARRRRFEEARARLEEAARLEMPWAEERAAKALGAIDAAERNWAREHEAQAAAFADLVGRAVLEAGRAGVPAARRIVESGGEQVAAWDAELGDLREDLDALARVGLDPDAVAADSPRGAMTLVLVHLAHGEVDRAEEALAAVRAAEGDEAAARARILATRRVLAREAQALVERGRADLAAGRLDDASKGAADARRLAPELEEAVVLEARVCMARGELDRAEILLGNVVSRIDVSSEARYRHAQLLLLRREDLGRVATEIERAIADAGDDEPWLGEARAELDAVKARRVESDVRRWRDTAKSWRTRGKRDAAEGALGRILGLLPDDADALLTLAQIYSESKRTTPASILLARVGQLEKATDAQRRRAAELLAPLKAAGVSASAEDGRDLATTASRAFRAGSWQQAVRHANLALALSPHLEATRVELARAYLVLARESAPGDEFARAALENADQLVRLYPEDALPLALRADAHLLLRETTKGLNDAAKAAILDPRCAAAHAVLGRARLATGDAKGAMDAMTLAVRHDPAPAHFLGLAEACLAADDRERARGILDNYQHRFGRDDAWRALQRKLDEE